MTDDSSHQVQVRLNNVNYSYWYFSLSVNHHILILNLWNTIQLKYHNQWVSYLWYFWMFEPYSICIIGKCLNHILFVLLANVCMTCSRISLLEIFSVLSLVIALISFAMKFSSFLLFLTNVCFLVWICSSIIAILTVREAWSNESFYSG